MKKCFLIVISALIYINVYPQGVDKGTIDYGITFGIYCPMYDISQSVGLGAEAGVFGAWIFSRDFYLVTSPQLSVNMQHKFKTRFAYADLPVSLGYQWGIVHLALGPQYSVCLSSGADYDWWPDKLNYWSLMLDISLYGSPQAYAHSNALPMMGFKLGYGLTKVKYSCIYDNMDVFDPKYADINSRPVTFALYFRIPLKRK